jgi:hypothetical protein
LQILEEAGFGTGPLADVQVYGSDVFDRYVGMSHAIGCHHHELLRADDDLLSLGELLPLWMEARAETERNYWSRRWCSKCGGFSIRRLSDAQFEWVATCRAITELRKTLEWYERQEPALRAIAGAASRAPTGSTRPVAYGKRKTKQVPGPSIRRMSHCERLSWPSETRRRSCVVERKFDEIVD